MIFDIFHCHSFPNSSTLIGEEMSFVSAKNKYHISMQGNCKHIFRLNNSSASLSCQTHISKGKEKVYGIHTKYFVLMEQIISGCVCKVCLENKRLSACLQLLLN